MSHSRRNGFFAFVCGGIVLSAFACSSRKGFETEPALVASDAATPDAPQSCVHCSRDLKKVLDGCESDETAEVVATCNQDEGCGAGKCVDACTAASLNQGSVGCEFWTLPPSDNNDARGSCFAGIVANTWDRPVSILAEFQGKALDISKSTYVAHREGDVPVYTLLEGPVPQGEVAIVFFAQAPSASIPCPETVTPALAIDPFVT